MDLSKLSVQFLQGYKGRRPLPDGYTQRDKREPYFSVVYPLEGYYELSVEDGKLQTVPPDGCFLVPPGVRHTLIHRSDTGHLLDRWAFFSIMYRDVLDATGWFRPPLILRGKDAAPFRAAVDGLVELPDDPYRAAFQKLRIAGELLEVLWEISDFQPTEHRMGPILPAVELIRDRYPQRLTVEDMASVCGMSVSAFHRAFRDAARKTPMQYLNDHRLKLAAGLILQERLTLSEIAARCGFCDEFHLSHNFKRSYGVSPREYRIKSLL